MKTAMQWNQHISNNSPVALTPSQFTTDEMHFHITFVHKSSHIAKYMLYMQVKTNTDPSPFGKQLLTFASALQRCKNCLAFQNCSIWIQSQQGTCVGQWIQLLHATFLLSAKHASVTSKHIFIYNPQQYKLLMISCQSAVSKIMVSQNPMLC
jgi:hypothetical protein